METKICQYCKNEIIGKRTDAKYCSNTCKAKHWEDKKTSTIKPFNSVVNNLRGVLQTSEDLNKAIHQNIVAPIIKKEVTKQAVDTEWLGIEREYKRLSDVKKQCMLEIQALQGKAAGLTSNNSGIVLTSLGVGALFGNKVAVKKEMGTVLGGVAGLLAGILIKEAITKPLPPETKAVLLKLAQEIKDKDSHLKVIDEKLILLKQKLDKKPLQNLNRLPDFKLSKAELIKLLGIDNLSVESATRLDKDVFPTTIASDKIINSKDLSNMEFKALHFQGEWQDFFGLPSINFHCVIHGMSGEGKSTFSIQFAKYLADNFGRTIYISGEEGFSKTFKDKFTNNSAVSKFLDVADLRTFDNIIQEVPQETYNFIFIDSLDNMKIDAAKMKIIKAHYKNSALITISQATKNGKMRGSYEIVHDSDIEVDVVKGIAETNKNRFKEKGMFFEVFRK